MNLERLACCWRVTYHKPSSIQDRTTPTGDRGLLVLNDKHSAPCLTHPVSFKRETATSMISYERGSPFPYFGVFG
ncbi:hypothetical protein ACHAWO_011269 [Cyclotella atomus]|uniref:Uncharacterized protein n=1 Tax=Cyclotella atomus TaxID=382360 RepID=A0ABD3MVW4_9STRA